MVAYAESEAVKRPAVMTEIPREELPYGFRHHPGAPETVYQSRRFLAQLYRDQCAGTEGALRLSVNRCTLNPDGRWQENLSWNELMQVKRECGFGDWYAVEVYPRDRDIVNVANMRHLWLLTTPLPIGWFSKGAA